MRRSYAFLAAILLAASVQAATPAADEPLDPDKAFHPDARLVAGASSASGSERHGIDVDYRIAPGYYLYRDRLRFEIAPANLLIGPPEFPPGLEVDDPFIGRSVIYRDQVTIHLPFMVSMAKPGRYWLRITAQGCAEDRICYAPFPQEVVVNIPPGYRVTDGPQAPARRAPPP